MSYKTTQEGVFGYQGFGGLHVKNVQTLDCGIGLSLMIGGANENNYLTLSNSVIFGESAELPQDSGASVFPYPWFMDSFCY